jgi:putative transposase
MQLLTWDNAYAEGFVRSVRSVKEECLSKLIPIGPGMLKRSLCEYVKHYHRERNHQGVGNRLITPMITRHHVAQTIVRRPRLGGILNFYQRAAP